MQRFMKEKFLTTLIINATQYTTVRLAAKIIA